MGLQALPEFGTPLGQKLVAIDRQPGGLGGSNAIILAQSSHDRLMFSEHGALLGGRSISSATVFAALVACAFQKKSDFAVAETKNT